MATMEALPNTQIGLQPIALDLLTPSPTNPRKHFSDAEIKSLADNIAQQGLIEPIIVRPAPVGYEIVAGERRYRALKSLGKHAAECVVRELTDAEVLDMQVSENLQREDLTPLDWAAAYKALVDHEKKKQGAGAGALKAAVVVVGARLGKSPSVVYQTMQLTKLIPAAALAVEQRKMSKNHAIDCARLKPVEQMKYLEEFNGQAGTRGTPSVRQMREWIEKHFAPKPEPIATAAPATRVPDALEERPPQKTGAPDKHEAPSGRSVPAQQNPPLPKQPTAAKNTYCAGVLIDRICTRIFDVSDGFSNPAALQRVNKVLLEPSTQTVLMNLAKAVGLNAREAVEDAARTFDEAKSYSPGPAKPKAKGKKKTK